jgi:hypothetical protein
MIWIYSALMVGSGVAYLYTNDWIFFPPTLLFCAGVWWEWKKSRRRGG